VNHFNEGEFPPGELKDACPTLLTHLDAFRDYINMPIYPSRRKGALARYSHKYKTSMHYADASRHIQSRAIDVFIGENPEGENADWVFLKALQFGWGGVGVYFDTVDNHGNDSVMYHLDLRHLGTEANGGKKPKTFWFRDYGVYHWPNKDHQLVMRMMAELANR